MIPVCNCLNQMEDLYVGKWKIRHIDEVLGEGIEVDLEVDPVDMAVLN
jgi:hypothetical protein